mmetsp:Transcript_31918/g.76236  ORF Transcript_31918/g.76236 Transcript_31918/m.76236 type:complete len:210 (+) Transcript_31918:654-1283(+)
MTLSSARLRTALRPLSSLGPPSLPRRPRWSLRRPSNLLSLPPRWRPAPSLLACSTPPPASILMTPSAGRTPRSQPSASSSPRTARASRWPLESAGSISTVTSPPAPSRRRSLSTRSSSRSSWSSLSSATRERRASPSSPSSTRCRAPTSCACACTASPAPRTSSRSTSAEGSTWGSRGASATSGAERACARSSPSCPSTASCSRPTRPS